MAPTRRSSASPATRHNGTVTEHRTMFVGFCGRQGPLTAMLESMAGVRASLRDALTRYTRALTGAYYFVPSGEAIRRFAMSLEQS